MQPLTANDIWPLGVYEGVRKDFRRQVMEAKEARRIAVGPFMSFVFENRMTVKFQVQEILRVERISAPEQVAEEVEGFNGMLPGPGELSATLLIELLGPDAEVKAQLAKLYRLREHVFLDIAGRRVAGHVEAGREEPGRVSAVQYVRFRVPDRDALLRGPVFLGVDHPAYNHRQELGEHSRRALAQDLA